MVATNLKAETVKLMDQRSAIESEIDALIHRLSLPPASPGLSSNLVDSEGFPRTDIDILTVLADRRRVAELRNDYKDLTEKINQNILLLHAAKPRPKSSPSPTFTPENYMEIDGGMSSMPTGCEPASLDHTRTRNFPAPADKDAIANIPFVMVDEIAESSPAAEDGLQLGDQIVTFGSVESGENVLPRLAQEVQTNQGSSIPVAIMRQGALISLSITPRTWQGRGLMGIGFLGFMCRCHFKLL